MNSPGARRKAGTRIMRQSLAMHFCIREFSWGVLATVAVAAASITGQLATYTNLSPWYSGLTKPSFNPPNWIFAPVWTALYVMMAFALWRILRMSQASRTRRVALSLFFIQLALNAAWSWMFFGARNPLLGMINIIPQVLAILASVVAFHRLDRMAAWCLVPLVA